MKRSVTRSLFKMGLSFCLGMMLISCATRIMVPASASAYWSGRLALQINSEPIQQMSVSFELQGSPEQGELILFSPIGTTMAKLNWTPQMAWIEQNGHRNHGANLQAMTEQLTGTSLPISALFEWLAGREQAAPGWQVDLSTHPEGRLTAQRKKPQPETVLRIILDR
ncbi:lipoprotein insertase outer membrane protein LolB [Limnohabitans planktonicus]|uniref:Outer-membrane lipoprotein LolB n=1 Tax=Limnohabitans planktonicus II-D5 TaxID=1293045 RepID=A0A2T7UCC7_9BURK|nr:lipoprotein insertase outer membrane protein LolB [Limnohabitans planktonicus]PVE42314.1 outer membrane lipoprotein LolB [Limnohabitans planktonicus II-D5]|eukprot:gene19069-21689_t